MRKVFIPIFLLSAIFAPHAFGWNVLAENQNYKKELENLSSAQNKINKKEILYYKGKQKTSTDKDKTLKTTKKEKKGIRFKTEEVKQNQPENKEVKASPKNKEQKKPASPDRVQNDNTPKSSGSMPKNGDNHNADAE